MDTERFNKVMQLVPSLQFKSSYLHSSNDFNRYAVTLKTAKGSASFPYFQGTGIQDDPTVLDVLYCLVSDASEFLEYSFSEFTDNFGYEPEQAKTTYKQCQKISEKLERLDILKHLEELQNIFQDY